MEIMKREDVFESVMRGNTDGVTMDSREIAELVEKEHKNILRDIRKQLDVLGLAQLKFEHSYLDKNKQSRLCYKLDYEQTMTLVSGYSILLRNKIIKRWLELEKEKVQVTHNTLRLPQSFSDALLLAYNQALQLEEQKPKVDYYENVLDSKSTFTVKQVATQMGISPQALNKLLCEKEVQYKQSGMYHLYTPYKDKGYTDVRHTPITRTDGRKDSTLSLVWTEKGIEFIHSIVK